LKKIVKTPSIFVQNIDKVPCHCIPCMDGVILRKTPILRIGASIPHISGVIPDRAWAVLFGRFIPRMSGAFFITK
jgi:hypothetical protein